VAIEAARRKFTPEFMNRIDKVVVFRPLGQAELRRILDIELSILQQRIFDASTTSRFVFSLTEAAKGYLLREGTDMKYGARHLKRAIDRALVHPMSNLIATEQVRGGDLIKVGFDPNTNQMTFAKEAEDIPAYAMAEMIEASVHATVSSVSACAAHGAQRVAARGRRERAGDGNGNLAA
jgi:ATP-dependent Clp protease ATP-binding subunit ClpA